MDRESLNSIACEEYNQVSRRQLMTSGVKVGVLSALGIGLTDYFQMAQAMPMGIDSGKATSVVLLWLGGDAKHFSYDALVNITTSTLCRKPTRWRWFTSPTKNFWFSPCCTPRASSTCARSAGSSLTALAN